MTIDTDQAAAADPSGSAAPPGGRRRSLELLVATSLAIVTLLVFSRLVLEPYQFLYYDDHDYVFNNPHVSAGLTWRGIAWAFSPSTRVSSNWHPLTLLSHMLDCQLFGLEPRAHHICNLLWHTANVLLLFGWLRAMTGALWRSALVAALFAWHPLHVESVAWIAERKDLLCAFFWFSGTWCYVSYVRRPGVIRYLSVTLCLLLGFLSKPMIVTFPCALLLLDYWPLGRYASPRADWSETFARLSRLIVEKLPWFLLVAAGCLITLAAQETAIINWERLTLSERLTNAAFSYDQYLLKAIWPSRLATPQVLDENGRQLWQVAVALLPLAVITALLMWLRRTRPYGLVGWLWYLGTLVPVIGLIQVGVQAWADRYTYIPLVGIFLVVAWGLGDVVAAVPRLGRWVSAVMVGVLVLLAALTVHQLGFWRDTIVLLRHTIEITGPNIPAQYGLASALRAEQRYDEAIEECDRIIRQEPDFFEAHYMRGRALRESDRPVEAAAAFTEALRQANGKMDPRRTVQLSVTAAQIYATHPNEQVRDPQLAIELAENASKITHYSDAVVLDTLAAAYAAAGRFSEAQARSKTALELAIVRQQAQLAKRIAGRLDLYQRGQAYHAEPSLDPF